MSGLRDLTWTFVVLSAGLLAITVADRALALNTPAF
jgi:hypothetical protein